MSNQDFSEKQLYNVTQYMYLGLIPFFIGAIGPWLHDSWTQALSQFFIAYAAIILAFLAGALWGISLFSSVNVSSKQLHAAITFSLIAFIPVIQFLPISDVYRVICLGIGFLCLLNWEKRTLASLYPAQYLQFRHKISFIVLGCHMLVVWNLIR